MPTLDERIEAARKLEGYTPGPWYQGSHVPESASVWIGGRAKEGGGAVLPYLAKTMNAKEGGGAVLPYLAKTMNWPANYSANARLIAAAPDLHRLALDLAAERERLLATLRRIAGKGDQVYCRDGHEECALLARAALAPEPRA